MARFIPGKPIVTTEPSVLVEGEIPMGQHRFTLVVEDDEGNRSAPAEVIVDVLDQPPPPEM